MLHRYPVCFFLIPIKFYKNLWHFIDLYLIYSSVHKLHQPTRLCVVLDLDLRKYPFAQKTWKRQKHGIFVECLQCYECIYFWEIQSFLITIRMIDSTQLIHAYDMKRDNWKENTKMHIIMLCWFASICLVAK